MSDRLDGTVLVIGAGPCGVVLAIELGHRGVSTIVLEETISSVRFSDHAALLGDISKTTDDDY